MSTRRSLSLMLCLLTTLACFHATVETGARPSTVTIDKPWASGWVFGLVPPRTVETAAKCPTGVAKIETQLSFLNMLVAILTLNIYTPMNIRVTCAEAPTGSAIIVPDSASAAAWQAAIAEAASRSQINSSPVFVTTVK